MESESVKKEEVKVNVKKTEEGAEVTLRDGKIALIKVGKGRHARKAQTLAADSKDDKGGAYLSILMSLLVTIDGKSVVPEDLDDLDIRDYNDIFAEFSELNF
jgi:hypothetical protein